MRILATIVVASLTFAAHAQVDVNKYVNVAPPNVASFEKYGNIPINYSTGQVSYNIPLYSFEVDNRLKIPIELNYASAGLKPDEVPSWVGNAWDLMPGGYITQQVRGANDFSRQGLTYADNLQTLRKCLKGEMTDNEKFFYIRDVFNKGADSQFDLFSLNLLGQPFKFYFNGEQVVFVKYAPYRVQYDKNTGKFAITDDWGYIYHFELSVVTSGSYTDNVGNYEFPLETNASTWYLTRIITPAATQVTFDYQADGSYLTTHNGFTYSFGANKSGDGCSSGFGIPEGVGYGSFSTQFILKTITHQGRKVEFGTIPRQDLTTIAPTIAKALASVAVTNEANQVIKDIRLTYTNQRRLQLDKVAVYDQAANLPVQNYTFTYYGNASIVPLPTAQDRTYGIDHWGFYNGKSLNSSNGIPKIDYGNVLPNAATFKGDSNRGADAYYSQMGLLQRITYPTGGYSELEYSGNQTFYNTLFDVPTFLKPDIVEVEYSTLFATGLNCWQAEQNPSSGTFEVPQNYNRARLDWGLRSNNSEASCFFRIKRIGSTEEIFKLSSESFGTEDLSLTAGTYSYEMDAGCIFAMDQNVTNNAVRFKLEVVPNSNIPVKVGGNRVVRIKDYDAITNQTVIRQIDYEEPHLVNEPIYITRDIVVLGRVNSCGTQQILGGNNLNGWDGFPIDYGKVTEYLGEGGENGKQVYFYPGQDYVGGGHTGPPFSPTLSLPWRGALSKLEVHEKKGTAYQLKRVTSYEYTARPGVIPLEDNGLKFGIKAIEITGTYSSILVDTYYNRGLVTMTSDRFDRSKVTEIDYSSGAAPFTKETFYSYSPDFFRLSRTRQKNSIGQDQEQSFWYANDFNESLSDASIAQLKTKNIISLPLKTVAARNGQIISGVVNQCDAWGNILQTFTYENTVPQTLPTHDPNSYLPTGFTLKQTLTYTGNNKLQQQQEVNDISTTYLWGYNRTYPVAEIKNATYAEVVAVLGQSVVDELAGATPGSDAEVRQKLAPLRTDARLKKAQVTTFTYQPLVGMTSQTDASGKTTYFEYDALQRLRLTKDANGHLLRQQVYHYQGQPVEGN